MLLAALGLASAPRPARAQTRWYVFVQGTDTASIERFERRVDTVTGVWISYHPGGMGRPGRDILRHEYTIGLTPDGRPAVVRLALRRPDGPVIAAYVARFTDDSVVIADSDDTVPHRLAAHRAFPVLGRSMAMAELLIAGARPRNAPLDSGTVVAMPVTGPFVTLSVPFRWTSERTVVVGRAGLPPFILGHGGVIDSVVAADGSVPLRRVTAFDIDAVALAAAKGTYLSSRTAAGRVGISRPSALRAASCQRPRNFILQGLHGARHAGDRVWARPALGIARP